MPSYIRNPTEDPTLPVHEDSVCAVLTGKTLADFCEDCAAETTFIAASAEDFALKQIEDDYLYREMLGATPYNYDAASCDGVLYDRVGYDTVMQSGAETYRNDDEKIVKMIALEAQPEAQSTPSDLECDVGYGNQPSCMTWKPIRTLPYECVTELTAQQLAERRLRKDGNFYFPTWRRGRYLAHRFRLSGIGGAGTFSSMSLMLKGWGQADSP